MDRKQIIDDFNDTLKQALQLMAYGKYADAELQIRNSIDSLPAGVWETVSAVSRAEVEGCRAVCLFNLAKYSEAVALLRRIVSVRRNHGMLDEVYLGQLRTLALALRGLCRFDECVGLLREAQSIAAREHYDELAATLDKDLRQTKAIEHDEPQEIPTHLPFKVSIAVIGNYGTSPVGFYRMSLPTQMLGIECCVHRLEFRIVDLYRVRICLDFSLNNSHTLSRWTGSGQVETPCLFGLLLPRGARVNRGCFRLDINDADWQDRFFLENRFYTIFHPYSYPVDGFYPLPICKAYKYVQAQSSLFRSRIPKRATIHFDGVIDYPPPPDGPVRTEHELALFVLLPYSPIRIGGLDRFSEPTSLEQGVAVVGRQISVASFFSDRERFVPNAVDVNAPPQPVVGEERAVASLQGGSEDGVRLESMSLLGVRLAIRPTSPLAMSLQPLMHLLPTGMMDVIKQPDPFTDFALDAEPTTVPLLRCTLENRDDCSLQLLLETTGEGLGIHCQQRCTIGAGQRQSLSVLLAPSGQLPLFPDAFSLRDENLQIQSADVSVTLKSAAEELSEPLLRHLVALRALPPDYAIWAITNHRDGTCVDLRNAIARWVTPNEPLLERFLEHRRIKKSGDPMQDLHRIYDGLLDIGFSYDNERLNFGTEMEHDYQRVRFPAVSLVHRRINCIDGTVLLASFAERLGYEPVIVFTPGHAFFAVIRTGTSCGEEPRIESMAYVETTGLCPHWFIEGDSVRFDDTLPGGRPLSYLAALEVGLKQFNDNDIFEKLRDHDEGGLPRYRIIVIPFHSRKEGILPLNTVHPVPDGDPWEVLGSAAHPRPIASTRQRASETLSVGTSPPHPLADPERAMRLNRARNQANARWKALPWWKRWFTPYPAIGDDS